MVGLFQKIIIKGSIVIALIAVGVLYDAHNGWSQTLGTLNENGLLFHNSGTVARRPIAGTTHTYGGKVIDKRLLYNPHLEEIFGVPFYPDTYTYQYYYVPPYGYNSPYLYPSETQYLRSTPGTLSYRPVRPPIHYSSGSISGPKHRQEEARELPIEMVPVVASVIDALMREGVNMRDDVSRSRTRFLRVGDWSGNMNFYGTNNGRVSMRNSKGESIQVDFRRIGNTTYYDLNLHSQGEGKNWYGSSNTLGSSGSVRISSSSGTNIRGSLYKSGNSYNYNYDYDSSKLNVKITPFGSSSDRYNVNTFGNKYMSGYLN